MQGNRQLFSDLPARRTHYFDNGGANIEKERKSAKLSLKALIQQYTLDFFAALTFSLFKLNEENEGEFKFFLAEKVVIFH